MAFLSGAARFVTISVASKERRCLAEVWGFFAIVLEMISGRVRGDHIPEEAFRNEVCLEAGVFLLLTESIQIHREA